MFNSKALIRENYDKEDKVVEEELLLVIFTLAMILVMDMLMLGWWFLCMRLFSVFHLWLMRKMIATIMTKFHYLDFPLLQLYHISSRVEGSFCLFIFLPSQSHTFFENLHWKKRWVILLVSLVQKMHL